MTNIVTSMMCSFFVLAASFFCNSSNIAFGQAEKGKAEAHLANYFLTYDDFYRESAVFYHGGYLAVRPDKSEKEFVRSISGYVVESATQRIKFTSMTMGDLLGPAKTKTYEELIFKGKLWTKAYGGNGEFISATSLGDPADRVSPVAFKIQPHGLALLRDIEIGGNMSNLQRCVPMFLNEKRFIEETELESGGVRGVWETQNGLLRTSIDFSSGDDPVPIKTVWEAVPGPKTLGLTKTTTITKWQKVDKFDVPSSIQMTGRHANDSNEVELKFEYVDKERFDREIKKLDSSITNMSGAWKKVFESWFDEERSVTGKR